MEEERNPSEEQAEAPVETQPEAQPDNATNGEVGLVEAINKVTGRTYKSDEEALKGIEETTKYVGKVGKYKDLIEQIEKTYGGETKATEALKKLTDKDDETPKLRQEIEALKEKNFYAENKKFEPYQKLISALRKDGETLEDVIAKDEFKLAFRDDSEKPVKSVIHSNSRIAGDDSDYQRDFQKAQESGDWSQFLAKHKGVSAK